MRDAIKELIEWSKARDEKDITDEAREWADWEVLCLGFEDPHVRGAVRAALEVTFDAGARLGAKRAAGCVMDRLNHDEACATQLRALIKEIRDARVALHEEPRDITWIFIRTNEDSSSELQCSHCGRLIWHRTEPKTCPNCGGQTKS